MTQYLVRRILESIPVIIGVSILVFGLIHFIPGDPATAMLGERATEENVEAIRERLGLNEPLHVQYFIWVGNIMQGDLGKTVQGNISISAQLSRRFPATIELAITALIFAIVLGIPIGIVSAVNRNSMIDTASMVGALLGVSIPIFVLGLLLIYLFGVILGWLPFVGRLDSDIQLEVITGFYMIDSLATGNMEAFRNTMSHLLLPALTLMTIPLSIIARITRSTMLDVLNQDYMRTARAKGLKENNLIIKHGLRNALLPVITIIGLQLGALLSGAVLTETIFSWPGIGKWLFDSIISREYPIVQSVTLLIAMLYVGANLSVDLLYTLLDPRVRFS